jgi:hypothetical protein
MMLQAWNFLGKKFTEEITKNEFKMLSVHAFN